MRSGCAALLFSCATGCPKTALLAFGSRAFARFLIAGQKNASRENVLQCGLKTDQKQRFNLL
jgi:hypothetical protein